MIKSFHGKLIVGAGAVFTVTFVIFAGMYLRTWQRELEDFHVEQFSDHSEIILEEFFAPMRTGGMDSVRTVVEHHAHDPDISDIRLFNSEGRVIISASGMEGQTDSSLAALDSIFRVESRHVRRRDKLLSIIKRIGNAPKCHQCHPSNAEVLGYVQVDFRYDPGGHTGPGIYGTLAGFITVLIVLTAVLLWLFQHYLIRRPLSGLMATIGEVTAGDLTAQSPISGSEEIRRLSASFNELVTRLREAQKQITTLHEEQMEKAERLATAGEMASGIAHEIKNPLAGILSTIQVMMERAEKDSPDKEILEEIQTQIKRIEKTVKDLLSYACPPSPEFTTGDMNENIQRCVSFISSAAEQQQTALKVRLDDRIPSFYFDPALIDQVIINLLMNALQALKNGGTITITSRFDADAQVAEITIADNGPGMPEQIALGIFRPFFTTKHRGSGLGLSISKKNIERHGGTIDVSSKVGSGASFVIRLPVNLPFQTLVELDDK